MSASDFRLSDGERSSALWRRLAAHLNERIAELHTQLESQMPENETAFKRGQIKSLKVLLKLEDDDQPLTG